ncbi:MAG: repressor LexA [Chloroflexi bacterium]|nr:repressor LexA [Chloroflexota bacterium]MBT7080742.1 repressor LexA [Chloroflexota bacterium]MBT7290437.1 repressor LexA [Chloroflexota bacterium]
MSKSLSDKQRRMLNFINDFVDDNSYPPTVRDILKGCNISSTSVVDYNLRILEREGYLRRDSEVSRGIEIFGKSASNMVNVPILGTIAAGQPIPVPETDTWDITVSAETLEVATEMTRGSSGVYALKVRGTSMIDALIDDGDIVLMQQTSVAENSEMVAVWLKNESETTLKKFYKEPNRVRLQPCNVQLDPIYTSLDNVEIQGRVIGVIRKLK